jgi:DNA-binding LacI/PurR family transcriptional regulator
MRTIKRLPLRQQVCDALRREISKKAAGDRLDTEQGLAKRLDVSVLTVREALGMLAHEGLILRQQGRGTFVADRPISTKPQMVGVLSGLDITGLPISTFFLNSIRALRDALNQAGTKNRVYIGLTKPGETPEQAEAYTDLIADIEAGEISGLVVVTTPPHARLLQAIRAHHVWLVSDWADSDCSINTDDQALGRMGAEELARRGARSVGYVGWSGGMMRAFTTAATKLGLETRPEWLRTDLHPLLAGAGERQFQALRAGGGLPDAVLVGDVHLLDGFAGAATAAGIRLGEQLRLASHTFTGCTVAIPPGTSLLNIDTTEYGRLQQSAMARLLAGEAVERHVVLAPQLVPAG